MCVHSLRFSIFAAAAGEELPEKISSETSLEGAEESVYLPGRALEAEGMASAGPEWGACWRWGSGPETRVGAAETCAGECNSAHLSSGPPGCSRKADCRGAVKSRRPVRDLNQGGGAGGEEGRLAVRLVVFTWSGWVVCRVGKESEASSSLIQIVDITFYTFYYNRLSPVCGLRCF